MMKRLKNSFLHIVMMRMTLVLIVVIPTPIFIELDPSCSTLASQLWIVFGCATLILWYRFVWCES